MGTPSHDPEVLDALGTVQQYLSDSIAPISAADSVFVLMSRPAGILAPEIRAWTASQYQGQGAMVPLSDYLYHAAKKLHALGQLRLLPKDALTKYLDSLTEFLLDYCPEEDRALLRENLRNLDRVEDATAAPLPYVYRQVGATHVRESRGDFGGEEAVRRSRRFALLLERLENLTATAGGGAGGIEQQKQAIPRLLAAIAENSQSGPELQRVQEVLSHVGLESGMDQVFRTLSRSLPGWALTLPPEGGESDEPPGRTAWWRPCGRS